MSDCERAITTAQTAILWSGSALIIGALIGLGVGVTIGRRYGTKTERCTT